MSFLSDVGAIGLGAAGFAVGGPVGAAMMAGGAGILGGSQANAANERIAEENRAFQANMSGTSYQRAVKDLEAAGLNPMLAYGQGGASTPSGSVATMQNVYGDAANSAVGAYQSYQSAELQRQQVEQSRAQAALLKANTEVASAQAANIRSDTVIKDIQQGYWTAMIPKVVADTSLTAKQKDLVIQNIQNARLTGFQIIANTGDIEADKVLKRLQADQYSVMSKFYQSDIGKASPYLDKTLTWMNSASNILKPIGGKFSFGDTFNTGARNTSVINYGKD